MHIKHTIKLVDLYLFITNQLCGSIGMLKSNYICQIAGVLNGASW